MTCTMMEADGRIDAACGLGRAGGVALLEPGREAPELDDAPWLTGAQPLCDDGRKFSEEEEEDGLDDGDELGEDDAEGEEGEFDEDDEFEGDEEEFFDDDEEEDDLDASLDDDEDEDF